MSTQRERTAAAVRHAMTASGCSQARLAQVLRVSQRAVSRRLTGEVPFDVDELAAVAEYLHVSLPDLVAVA